MNDSEDIVRKAAVVALAGFGTSALPALTQAWKASTSYEERLAFIMTIPVETGFSQDSDPAVRETAQTALKKLEQAAKKSEPDLKGLKKRPYRDPR